MTEAPSALASRMPAPRNAKINGLDYHWYEVGQNTRGRAGVPVILCHGWPELAFSWRHQLAAFEAAGIWAIAPDQRGYGLTRGPAEVEAYDMAHLTGDLVALLDHLAPLDHLELRGRAALQAQESRLRLGQGSR